MLKLPPVVAGGGGDSGGGAVGSGAGVGAVGESASALVGDAVGDAGADHQHYQIAVVVVLAPAVGQVEVAYFRRFRHKQLRLDVDAAADGGGG